MLVFRPGTLLKRDFNAGVFLWVFQNILKNICEQQLLLIAANKKCHLDICLCYEYTSDAHCLKSVQIWSFFWCVFSRIRTEYGDLNRKAPYSVRIQENIWTLFTQWLHCNSNSIPVLAILVYISRGEHLRRSFFAKIVNGFYPLTIFAKKLYRRFLTGFQIRLWYVRKHQQKCNKAHSAQKMKFSIKDFLIRYDQTISDTEKKIWIHSKVVIHGNETGN